MAARQSSIGGAFGVRYTGKDLNEVSRELRRMNDKEIKKRFRQELRAAAAPLVPAVRASISAIPAKGPASTGLRRRLSRAVKLSVKTAGKQAAVTLVVAAERMPSGQKALPAYMEGTKPRWRHPVYGHDRWVTQPAHPYFYKVVLPLGASSRVAVNKVISGITKDIT